MRGFVGLVALVALFAIASSSRPDISLVRSADEDEIKSLPGLKDKINFKQYSGYIDGGEKSEDKKLVHYWFVESQNDPANDPVLLWLNGGPGCSSMEGLFKELGPFTLDPKDPKSVILRETSWNKLANVLFLESPLGVGYSYDPEASDAQDDDTTAKLNHLALKSFFKKFPQFNNNSLYLSGESYAGVYLPTLGVLVDSDPDLNLKGIAIGNGYLNAGILSDSLIFFAYHHGLFGDSTWQDFSKNCCQGQPPSPDTCEPEAESFECQITSQLIGQEIFGSGLNPYNIYSDCLNATSSDQDDRSREHLNRQAVDMALVRLALDRSRRSNLGRSGYMFNAKEEVQQAIRLGVTPPCTNENDLVNYLNRQDVRKAIHVPTDGQDWDICAGISYEMQYPVNDDGLKPQMEKLIDSKRNLALLVYNGDVDAVCNFLGDEWFVDQLGRKVVKDYALWKVGKQVGGWVKHYDGITFATIRGSGHMVPQDKPEAAFEMIKRFLNAKGKVIEI